MDTPSNKPLKNWNAVVAAAREARPPAGIDVRARVRRVIEAEAAVGPRAAELTTLWEELAAMAGTVWMRGLLGGSALAAIPLLSCAAQAARDLLDLAHLAAPLVAGY